MAIQVGECCPEAADVECARRMDPRRVARRLIQVTVGIDRKTLLGLFLFLWISPPDPASRPPCRPVSFFHSGAEKIHTSRPTHAFIFFSTRFVM
jgi:hypothetical protein